MIHEFRIELAIRFQIIPILWTNRFVTKKFAIVSCFYWIPLESEKNQKYNRINVELMSDIPVFDLLRRKLYNPKNEMYQYNQNRGF